MSARQELTKENPNIQGTTYTVWLALIWGLGLIPCLPPPFGPRSFNPLDYVDALESSGGISQVIDRLCSGMTLLLALVALFYGLRSKGYQRRNRWLLIGVFALGVGPLLSSFLGSSPKFSIVHMLPPLLFVAVLLLPPIRFEFFQREVKRVILFYVYGSFAAALLFPHWAMEFGYDLGFFSWMPIRLHGLAVHANLLAPFLLVYLALYMTTGSKRAVDRINLAAVLFALFLTQSKTTWVMVVLTYLFMKFRAAMDISRRLAVKRVLGYTAASVLIAFAVWLFWGDDIGVVVQDHYTSMVTLTGRLVIWVTSLDKFYENPLFGYGPHLWDPEMSLDYLRMLGWAPAQAHNQYVQTLSETGAVGLAGFLFYAFILLRYAWKHLNAYKGVAFVLLLMWFFRGLTESWYRRTVNDGNFFIHFILFSMLVLIANESTGDEKGLCT